MQQQWHALLAKFAIGSIANRNSLIGNMVQFASRETEIFVLSISMTLNTPLLLSQVSFTCAICFVNRQHQQEIVNSVSIPVMAAGQMRLLARVVRHWHLHVQSRNGWLVMGMR